MVDAAQDYERCTHCQAQAQKESLTAARVPGKDVSQAEA